MSVRPVVHSRSSDQWPVPAPLPGAVSGEPAASAMTVRVDRVDDEAGFRALATEWDGLLDASGTRNLFLSWDWVSL